VLTPHVVPLMFDDTDYFLSCLEGMSATEKGLMFNGVLKAEYKIVVVISF
jgi:hypothetical protein